jgi:hypothetical protein
MREVESAQMAGDRESWSRRAFFWDSELGQGDLRSLWEMFVRPAGCGQAGGPFASEPILTRIRTRMPSGATCRGWLMEQSGGLDI